MSKLMFFNANGLPGKGHEISDFASKNAIDVTFVAETWLKQSSSCPIRNTFLDMRVTNDTHMGREGREGIIGFPSREYKDQCKVIDQDIENQWACVSIGRATVAVCYFTPTTPEKKVLDFLDHAKKWTCEGAQPVLIIGDFNARMKMTGDNNTNPRGKALEKYLEESDTWLLAEPVQGKFTTRTSNGQGICDLILMTHQFQTELCNYTVHENYSLGGSDHRPITVEIPFAFAPDMAKFTRWNFTALKDAEKRKEYQKAVMASSAADEACSLLTETIQRAEWEKSQNLEQTEKVKQERIDACEKLLCTMMEQAMEQTCRRVTGWKQKNKEFETEELRKARQELLEAEKLLQRSNARAHWDLFNKAKERIHKETKARQTELFEKFADELANPSTSISAYKIISCIRRRETRTKTMLDADKMDAHRAHFLTTFGKQPCIFNAALTHVTVAKKVLKKKETAAIDAMDSTLGLGLDATTVNESNADLASNNKPRWKVPELEKHECVCPGRIANVLETMANGKASGKDGIAVEMIKFAGDQFLFMVGVFFGLVMEYKQIPSSWREAIVALIYKGKGDKSNAAFYRPISLTNCMRRLFERCFLYRPDMRALESKLTDTQGGFRKGRSALDQVYALHEIIQRHPHLIQIFLDIQAAYDTVNRKILWHLLETEFNVSPLTLAILKQLFDANKSFLAIDNKLSEPILNLGGLFQGSSLSSILFNCYINPLIMRLKQHETVNTVGIRTNNLFFADDGNLHATNTLSAQAMLDECMKWSDETGTSFAPKKCKAVASTDVVLRMGNIELEQVPSYKYLGIYVDCEGIDWDESAKCRITSMKAMTSWLKSKGLNATGWRPTTRMQMAKTFLRPMLDYGWALGLGRNTKKHRHVIAKVQKAQNSMLRAMFSGYSTTSIGAMHRLCCLEKVNTRVQELSAKFYGKLHNNRYGKDNVATRLYWSLLHYDKKPNSVTQSLVDNEIFTKAEKENHVLTLQRLKRQGDPPLKDPYPSKVHQQAIRYKHAGKDLTWKHPFDVAQCIKVNENLTPGTVFRSRDINRRTQLTLVRWMLGQVCYHMDCQECGEETSRRHGLACSGADTYLDTEFAPLLDPLPESISNGQLNRLDYLLRHFHNETDLSIFTKLRHAVELVQEKCTRLSVLVDRPPQTSSSSVANRVYHQPARARKEHPLRALERDTLPGPGKPRRQGPSVPRQADPCSTSKGIG